MGPLFSPDQKCWGGPGCNLLVRGPKKERESRGGGKERGKEGNVVNLREETEKKSLSPKCANCGLNNQEI